MRIRAYLFLMAAGILVPVAIVSGLALSMLHNAEREAALRGLTERANSMALLVDRELYSADAALRVLATSPSLEQGDLAGFYRQATSANRGTTGWTLLLDQDGRQLLNTAVPFGTPLATPAARERVQHVMAIQKTFVSNVMPGPVVKRLVSTVNVPVPVGDGRKYVLALAFSTGHFQNLVNSVAVPEGWLVAILDANGRFIARNVNADALVGKPARAELVQAAAGRHSGRVRHLTLEGVEVYDEFTRSSLSGWTIAVAAPVESMERPARPASFVALLGLLATAGLAGMLAVYVGRLHVDSIARAVDAANGLGQGIPPELGSSRVLEVDALHTALHAAGEQMRQAQAYRRDAEADRQTLLENEQKARRMAEAENAAKDQFLAMLGHELRNPLAPISTAAQLLRMQPGDQNRVRYASDVISRQVDHMNSLLGDMLDVSRVTRGLVSLSLEDLDLGTVLERALEQTHSLVEVKHHQLVRDIPPGPLMVRGDQTRLIQIFANLVNNAAKYTPPYGRIDVRAAVEGSHVVVRVSDNGEGLSPELLPRIFDLFSQGDRKPDRSQGGLGLGLALVKSLVQLHGGTVLASSAGPGLGSTFSVSLPYDTTVARAAPAPLAVDAVGAGALRVMIVDDNIDGAISLSLFLKEAGSHRVCTYYDASAALEWAAYERPDVFILDIGLPDITGYELARRLQAMPQLAGAVYIALTGYGQPQDKERAREAGFLHHVSKPADPQHILSLLEGVTPRPADASADVNSDSSAV